MDKSLKKKWVRMESQVGTGGAPQNSNSVETAKAGQLFPAKSRMGNLKALFGDTDLEMVIRKLDNGTGELLRAVNNILGSQGAEDSFSAGLF